MIIEQKAKCYDRYDEALEEAKRWHKTFVMGHNYPATDIKVSYESIFPELKESEDKRIMKEIISMSQTLGKTEWIAWIEKQTKQNQVNKAEQKFHEGDWIIRNNKDTGIPIKVIEFNGYYRCNLNGEVITLTLNDVHNNFHLWTIKDAKPGDILATLDYILIFKGFLKNNGGISYCHYDFGAGNPQFVWFEDKNWYFGKEAIVHPATKEQCDLLFSKMRDSGYEWDSNKKELNKFEPKFHEGEWITNGDYTWKIIEVKPLDYILQSQDGNIVDDTIFHVDEQFHSFTIEDAKDGDVLAYNDSKNNVWICIFKEYANERVYDYCTLDKEVFWEYGNWNYLASFNYIPATKEQCDLLFQKMKEARYKWNAEKKELREIEENTVWSEEDEERIKNILSVLDVQVCWNGATGKKENPYKKEIDWLKSLKDKVLPQSKQEWSEEDEKNINFLCKLLTDLQVKSTENEIKHGTNSHSEYYDNIKNWLKSIKDKVQSQKQEEWSNEDEENLNKVSIIVLGHAPTYGYSKKYNSWLKSLKDRYTWKPSDKQMNALKEACDKHWEPDGLDPLYTLYQDLKKLKV